MGCAPLIISGQIKVKQGVEIKRYTENGVIFGDESVLDADVVIHAYVTSFYLILRILF